uniref:Tyrosine-protein phosphatase domain-containing protein n=1 Tax=Urocitellus parryii TaxID=9999 RepID=A0A8D2IN70_UROPR
MVLCRSCFLCLLLSYSKPCPRHAGPCFSTSPWTLSSIFTLSQITRSLYISNGVAANSKLLLASNQITSVSSVSVEVVNTFWEDIQYTHVPVADAPSSKLYDFFDPIADHNHSVEMKQGPSFCHAMSLLDAHTWTNSMRPIIQPNAGFEKQLIHYEFQLFGKNTIHMVSSPMGMIPDIYEKEVHLMIPLNAPDDTFYKGKKKEREMALL